MDQEDVDSPALVEPTRLHLPSVDLSRITHRPRQSPPSLKVIFLGTAAASGLAQAPTSSMLLCYGDERILVDAGARSLGQLRRAGIDPRTLTGIVLTHWHGDHIAGLPALLAAAAYKPERANPLKIYAPPASRKISATLGVANHKLNVELVVAKDGDTIPISGGTLTVVQSDHVIPSLAYAFAEDGEQGRRVVFSGDTRPNLAVLSAARNADLLIHEATFVAARHAWAHRTGHCTAPQAAMVAKSANAGALALTHISARDQRPDVLREAQTIFPSAVLPDDLHVIEVLMAPRTLTGKVSHGRQPGWARLTHSRIRALDIPDADGLAS